MVERVTAHRFRANPLYIVTAFLAITGIIPFTFNRLNIGMNTGNNISRHLTMDQAHAIIATTGHAFCVDRPLNQFVTVHFNQAGIRATHAFVTGFFKLVGDWLRVSTKEPPYYVWVLENERNKGLHLHALVHVPLDRQMKFRTLTKIWLRRLGSNPQKNALHVGPVYHSRRMQRFKSASSIEKYLGFWSASHNRDGLKGVLGYMLKGLTKKDCDSLGIGYMPQGPVTGKRCGFSEALGPTRRNRVEPTWRKPHPGKPATSSRSVELWLRRFLWHAGLRAETGYVAPADDGD